MAGLGPILVTGGSGQVGTALQRLGPRFGVEIIAPPRAALDLSDPLAIETAIGRQDWRAVINCAAYTAVDRAESEAAAAFRINADAATRLAEATGARKIRLLHVSTDYVFDGSRGGLYIEQDDVAPLGVYGVSKEAGERGVRAGNADHLILRTAWVVSPWGNNFVKTMLRLGTERDELRVVDDQHGCPTSAADIAETLLTLATRTGPTGTYHFVNAGEATWCDLARAVFERVEAAGRRVPTVEPIATADYPTPARRPANSRLSTVKIVRDYDIAPRPWRVAIDEIVDELLEAAK